MERLKPLVAKEEIAQQQFDAAVSAADAAKATAEEAEADVAAARTAVAVAEQRAVQARAGATRAEASVASAKTGPEQLQVTRARAAAADARVKQMEATVAQAQLNLERTTVKAPANGIVGKRAIELGQQVQPGQPLFAIVSRDDVWVVANFKETQLAEMRPGQRTVVEVDALGGRRFNARLDSIGAATGAQVQPAAARERHRQLRQGGAARAGEDRAGRGPGSGPSAAPGFSVVPTIYTK